VIEEPFSRKLINNDLSESAVMLDSNISIAAASVNQLVGGLPSTASATSKPMARLSFRRHSSKRLVSSESWLGRHRRGVAVKELLLVLLVSGLAVVGLKVMDPLSDAQHDAAIPKRRKQAFQRDVPLGDEFLCLVSVDEYARRDSSSRPFYVSRVRFAGRNPVPDHPFLLDVIIVGGGRYWHDNAVYRAWTLMSPEAALAYLHEHGKVPSGLSELSEEDQISAVLASLSSHCKK
jgi:hypothetical protein